MSKKLLDSYSKSLLKGQTKTDDVILDDEKSLDRLKPYKEWAKIKGEMEIMFPFMSEEGNLIAQDGNGVKIILLKETLMADMPYYDNRVGEKLMANAFVVVIDKIDDKTDTVYVKSARSGSNARRATIKSRLIGELIGELKKGHTPRLAGKIEQVSEKRAVVNILNKGILGFCYVEKWQNGRTRNYKKVCKEGGIYEFDVVKQLTQQKGKPPAFELSRVDITPDPWESIPDEFFTKGAVLTVRCVERPEGKSYWWGASDLIPGIEMQADYTKKCGRIMESVIYKCTVDRVDREKHIFRVVPFGLADSDVGETEKAIRFLETRKTKNAK